MAVEVASPVSHLFKSQQDGDLITQCSDSLEIRDHIQPCDESQVKLFHCELQPIHRWSDAQWDYLEKMATRFNNLELVSFHMASCYDKPIIVGKSFQPGGEGYSRTEMLGLLAEKTDRIKSIFSNCEVALENNNFYATPAYEYVCDPDFIYQAVVDNDLMLLYDIAHAQVSAINKGVSFETYTSELPLDRTIQVHICKSGLEPDGSAYDAHQLPDDQEFDIVSDLAKKGTLKYATIEYYQSAQALCQQINILREHL